MKRSDCCLAADIQTSGVLFFPILETYRRAGVWSMWVRCKIFSTLEFGRFLSGQPKHLLYLHVFTEPGYTWTCLILHSSHFDSTGFCLVTFSGCDAFRLCWRDAVSFCTHSPALCAGVWDAAWGWFVPKERSFGCWPLNVVSSSNREVRSADMSTTTRRH